jgi:hypothetical protein
VNVGRQSLDLVELGCGVVPRLGHDAGGHPVSRQFLRADGGCRDAGPRQELRYDLPRAYTVMADACRVGKRDEARTWYRSAIAEWEAILAEGLYSPDAATGLDEVKLAEQKLRGPGE